MESNKQEESNLLNDNPIAAQAGGSWLSKHMGGGVSPLFSKGSMAYQKEEEGSPAKHVKYTKKNIKGEDQMVPTQHNHKPKEPGARPPKPTKPTAAQQGRYKAQAIRDLKAKKAKAKAK